ncbi:MAG TPA: hypothetical protein PKC30_14155 [Saprospiraceae bacterium]|nr:hypothetical protein [Saprospiraceae bacterium]
MWKKAAKIIGKLGKDTADAVNKSMDFIDDALEKEVITGAIQSIKDASGRVVQEAGTLFEKSKQKAEKLAEDEPIKKTSEEVNEIVQEMKEKATKWADSISKEEKVSKMTEKAKEFGEGLSKAAEEIIDYTESFFKDKSGDDKDPGN